MAWTNVESAVALSGPRCLHELANSAMAVLKTVMVARARMAAYDRRGCASVADRARWRCRIARLGAVLPLRKEPA
jgi:hypothetical protein